MKVKSESEVDQSCPTRKDPVDCSLPGSSVHGIFQAGVLEWGAIAFSGKTVWRFPKKLQMNLPYDLATPLLGTHTEKTTIEKDHMYPQYSTIYNN